MIFTLIVFFTAFSMEAIGSYLSVIGLSSMFAGDKNIIVTALVLDVAKIVSVSLLYKHWTYLPKLMKFPMIIAAMILMIFTSYSAFGYFTHAFQVAVAPNAQVDVQTTTLQTTIAQLTKQQADIQGRKDKMDAQVAALPANNVKARKQLMATFSVELTPIRKQLDELDQQLSKDNAQLTQLQISQPAADAHAGPIISLAKMLNVTTDQAVKYVVLMIISVFDPLAILLVLSGNFLLEQRRKYPERFATIKSVDSEDALELEPTYESEEIIEDSAPQEAMVEPQLDKVSEIQPITDTSIDMSNPEFPHPKAYDWELFPELEDPNTDFVYQEPIKSNLFITEIEQPVQVDEPVVELMNETELKKILDDEFHDPIDVERIEIYHNQDTASIFNLNDEDLKQHAFFDNPGESQKIHDYLDK